MEASGSAKGEHENIWKQHSENIVKLPVRKIDDIFEVFHATKHESVKPIAVSGDYEPVLTCGPLFVTSIIM